MEENKINVGELWYGGERQFVFHGGYGKPLYFTYPSKCWGMIIARHKLKRISLHRLRHSIATILLENNTDLKTIQERLRHSQYSTTADLYTHVTKKVSKAAAEKFEKLDPKKMNGSIPV